MPVQIVKGNIWEYPADVRINTVNCIGVMGKGIALEFKNRYPEMFLDYAKECFFKRLKPGGIIVWHKESELIINVATKDHWKNPSQYDWIETGVNNISDVLTALSTDNKLAKVALPAMGCANGGLDFAKVSKIIIDKLNSQPHEIMLFETNVK